MAAGEGVEAGGARGLGGLLRGLGDGLGLARDEEQRRAVGDPEDQARPGAVHGDGGGDRGRVIAEVGGRRPGVLRRREPDARRGAGARAEQHEAARALALEERGDLLLEAGAAERPVAASTVSAGTLGVT